MSKNVKLTVQQQRVLTSLLEGKSISDAAKLHNVARQTVHNWMNAPQFQAAFNKGRLEIASEAISKLIAALDICVTGVIHLAKTAEDEPTRLRACLAIPTMLNEISEHHVINERLLKLEEGINAQH